MRRFWIFPLLISLALIAFKSPTNVTAQEATPTSAVPKLSLYTDFPSQVVGLGETVSFSLKLKVENTSQTVQLKMETIPQDWTATFRGSGQIVQSAHLEPDNTATVDLRLEPPAGEQSGTYNFVVLAQGDQLKAELPIQLTVQEKLPPKMSLTVDLPTIVGTPKTTFRYNATLKNEGDEDLSVNLVPNAPSEFQVTFQLSGQDVSNIPLPANSSKSLSIQAQPVGNVQAGSYPIVVHAQGGDANADLNLEADVTGQTSLSVSSPDGRLSGQAYVGRDSSLKVDVSNTGSAPALGVEMSSTSPSGWTVSFDPKQIDEIPAGQQVEVNATIHPSDQSVAGDYMVTVNAKSTDGSTQSADFRITVLTSTLWGVAGIGLIAVALGVVALAVMRFGRR
jgi:uncharacterized membrane protein